MPVWACFSYSADSEPDVTDRDTAQRALPGLRTMPGYPCFAYPRDIPLGQGSRDAAQRDLPGVRRMPGSCFRY